MQRRGPVHRACPTCQPTNQSRGTPCTLRRLQARTRSTTDRRAPKSEAPKTTATTATTGSSATSSAQERQADGEAGCAEPNRLPEASTLEPRPGAVPGRVSSAAAVHAQSQRAATQRQTCATRESRCTRITCGHERWDIPCCCNEVRDSTYVVDTRVTARSWCGDEQPPSK
jgi:hypothetical protein